MAVPSLTTINSPWFKRMFAKHIRDMRLEQALQRANEQVQAWRQQVISTNADQIVALKIFHWKLRWEHLLKKEAELHDHDRNT